MDETVDINDLLGFDMLGDDQVSQHEPCEYPCNNPEEHAFIIRTLESAANDVDSPITDDDVESFKRDDDLYPLIRKVLHHACEDSETPDHLAHVAMCSMFSVVMREISNGSAPEEANSCSLIACHPLTHAAIANATKLPESSEEFMESIASNLRISEWLRSEKDTTCELLHSRRKMVKRFSKHMLDFQFNNMQPQEHEDGLLPVDFADNVWLRKALAALRQFGYDVYKGKGHRLIGHVFNIDIRTECVESSRFVGNVLKSLDDCRNIAAMDLTSLYEPSIYALALKFTFVVLFPSFHHVHQLNCKSPHAPSCTFDAPWEKAAARNSNIARLFVRLAVASYTASNIDKIIDVANDSRAVNLMDIPEEIWETYIMIPNIVSPILAAPRKRQCELSDTTTLVQLAGVYSGQTITEKTAKLIEKKDLRGLSVIPCALKHNAYIPQTEHARKTWSDDPSATKLGYLQNVNQLKKMNGFIGRLRLVNKTWRDALSKYTFRLKAHIDKFSESVVDMQQADFLMDLDAPPLPTLLKSRAATIVLTVERSVPVTTEGNQFQTETQTIPTSTLLNVYDQMDIKAVGKGAAFPAEFGKRMNLPGIAAQSLVVAHSNSSAKLQALDDNEADFLVPVMRVDARTTFSPWTFRCNASTTSISAARSLSGTAKHVPPLPLAFEALFSSSGGDIHSLAVCTPSAYIVSEKASNEARRLTAQKRKRRTERDRSTRKAAAGRILYVDEDE